MPTTSMLVLPSRLGPNVFIFFPGANVKVSIVTTKASPFGGFWRSLILGLTFLENSHDPVPNLYHFFH